MQTVRLKASILLVAAGVLGAIHGPAWARGDAGETVASPAVTPADVPTLADQIDSILAARFTAAENIAAQDDRRRALEALSQFAEFTVDGLIDASPSGESRASLNTLLRPVLARHQENIAAELAALGQARREAGGSTFSYGGATPRANAP